jgi:hypothetical protein
MKVAVQSTTATRAANVRLEYGTLAQSPSFVSIPSDDDQETLVIAAARNAERSNLFQRLSAGSHGTLKSGVNHF